MFTSFEEYLNRLKPMLDEAYDRKVSAILGDSRHNGLALFASALTGGKRIRGCFLVMISDIFGGSFEAALPRAVAVELIHSASLIHDDFIDQDTTRRNSPALWTLVGGRRAVLLGDLIFASTIASMSELSREDGLAVSRAIALVSKGAFNEQLDPPVLAKMLESNAFDRGIYDEIIALKTGILFGTACQLGAISAHAGDEVTRSLYQYGMRIGEAYQIADDLLELKLHLRTRTIGPKQMAALAPALCCFMDGIYQHIKPVLAGKLSEIGEVLGNVFQTAEKRMEEEIERRLESAVAIVEADLPRHGGIECMHKAPREIITLFSKG